MSFSTIKIFVSLLTTQDRLDLSDHYKAHFFRNILMKIGSESFIWIDTFLEGFLSRPPGQFFLGVAIKAPPSPFTLLFNTLTFFGSKMAFFDGVRMFVSCCCVYVCLCVCVYCWICLFFYSSVNEVSNCYDVLLEWVIFLLF